MSKNGEMPLKLGDKLEISSGGLEIYVSSLEDITPQGDYGLSIPQRHGRQAILRAGTEAELIFYRADGRYSMAASVLGYMASGSVQLLVVRPRVDEIRRAQRRRAFRMPMASVAVVGAGWPEVLPYGRPSNRQNSEESVKTVDISEYGVGFITLGQYNPGDKVYMRIALNWPEPGSPPVEVFGLVRRRMPVDSRSGEVVIGVEFTTISQNDRKYIAKYIIQKQQAEIGRRMARHIRKKED